MGRERRRREWLKRFCLDGQAAAAGAMFVRASNPLREGLGAADCLVRVSALWGSVCHWRYHVFFDSRPIPTFSSCLRSCMLESGLEQTTWSLQTRSACSRCRRHRPRQSLSASTEK